MLIKLYSFLVVFSLALTSIAQTERGNLLDNSLPESIAQQYYVGDKINLSSLRDLTNFITNRDITHYQNMVIPKRKKAVLRHVKQISEQLENSYLNGESRNKETDEKIYELVLISNSLKQRTYEGSFLEIPRTEKLSMFWHTVKSRW